MPAGGGRRSPQRCCRSGQRVDMRQQVNFYQPQFRERAAPLRADLLLKVCGALFAAMLIIYGFAANRVDGVAGEMRVIAAQEAAAVERLENLRGTIRNVLGERSWAERLEEASHLLEERESSLLLVSGSELGSADGFSGHLKALARQSTDGMWLTRISLSAQGDETRLEGESLKADSVPVYLQGLAAERPFADQRFRRLNIDREPEGTGDTVTFVVTSDDSFAGTDPARR